MHSFEQIGATPWVEQHCRNLLSRLHCTSPRLTIELFDHHIENDVDAVHFLPDQSRLTMTTHRQESVGGPDGGRTTLPVGYMAFLPHNMPIRFRARPGRVKGLSLTYHMPSLENDMAFERETWADFRLRTDHLDIQNAVIERLMHRIVAEMQNEQFGSKFMIDSLAMLALVETGRHFHRADEAGKGGLTPWQLNRIHERIESEMAGAVRVHELAELCRISPRHLMRAYRVSTGRTIGEAVRDNQMAYATRLLRSTGMAISEIATATGFSNSSNFATAFRRTMHMTPHEYRVAC